MVKEIWRWIYCCSSNLQIISFQAFDSVTCVESKRAGQICENSFGSVNRLFPGPGQSGTALYRAVTFVKMKKDQAMWD